MENRKGYKPDINVYKYDLYNEIKTAKTLATKHTPEGGLARVIEYELVPTGRTYVRQKSGKWLLMSSGDSNGK